MLVELVYAKSLARAMWLEKSNQTYKMLRYFTMTIFTKNTSRVWNVTYCVQGCVWWCLHIINNKFDMA